MIPNNENLNQIMQIDLTLYIVIKCLYFGCLCNNSSFYRDGGELRFKNLTIYDLGKCYHFFMKGLNEKSRFYFMYHPNVKLLAYLIYLYFYIRQLLKKSQYILCYEDGDLFSYPIGFITLEKKSKTTFEMGIAVSENKRGQGYGKLLMEEIISRAKRLDCKDLLLTYEPSNDIAKNLYLKFGFQEYGTLYSKSMFRKNRSENVMKLELNH